MIFREQELLFRGSKERLKRNISKKEGDFPAPGRFRMLWRSPYFKWGLSFRMAGCYETTEHGIRVVYQFRPTAATVLWVAIPMLLLLSFAAWEIRNGNMESAVSVSLFSLLYPMVALWQFWYCFKDMRRYFGTVTQ